MRRSNFMLSSRTSNILSVGGYVPVAAMYTPSLLNLMRCAAVSKPKSCSKWMRRRNDSSDLLSAFRLFSLMNCGSDAPELRLYTVTPFAMDAFMGACHPAATTATAASKFTTAQGIASGQCKQ